jgi:hypothetical protein
MKKILENLYASRPSDVPYNWVDEVDTFLAIMTVNFFFCMNMDIKGSHAVMYWSETELDAINTADVGGVDYNDN